MIFLRTLHVLYVPTIAVFAVAQSNTPAPTTTSTLEPCAEIAASQSKHYAVSPSATAITISADLAYACQKSVPLVKQDALDLLTGYQAFAEWQTTLAWLKSPPENWPFPATDIVGGLQELRDDVESGKLISEIDLEWRLVDIISSARDGHFYSYPDVYSTFTYFNPLGGIASVSTDGKDLPEVYLWDDLEASKTEAWSPSPIVKVNGIEVVSWLSEKAFNGTLGLQDLDALYNRLFISTNAVPSMVSYAYVAGYFCEAPWSRFSGSSISIEFQNGSISSSRLEAYSSLNFSTVTNGESFYQQFCNVTANLASTKSSTPAPTPSPDDRLPLYPSPIAVSEDATLAGYFLDDNVAVLSILEETQRGMSARRWAQSTLTEFLAKCRKENKTHLILDVSMNKGGTVYLGYDIFKQLFPTLEPYATAQMRATDQLNVLGSWVADQIPRNKSLIPYGLDIDGSFNLDDSGRQFESWSEFFGPVEVHGDKVTNHFHVNLTSAVIDETFAGIVVSGYGNNSDIAPQPFQSENIIVFGDGFCASTCTIMLHLLKYQAKVKTIVAGGRPQTGPMQAIGGVKGTRDETLETLGIAVESLYQQAGTDVVERANQTQLKDLMDHGRTVLGRSSNPPSVNLYNAIAEGDSSNTPLQFVYEAADCRIWYQKQHLLNITTLWQTVAEQAFGLNGKEKWSLCVDGSTGHPSSLSGDPGLFNGGEIANVTGYHPPDAGSERNTNSSDMADTLQSDSSGVTLSTRAPLMFAMVAVLGSVML